MTTAARLLSEIERRHTERAQTAALALWGCALLSLVLPWLVGLPGLLVSALVLSGAALAVMVLLQRVVAAAVAETAVVYGVCGRVVEFRVPLWRIVGAE